MSDREDSDDDARPRPVPEQESAAGDALTGAGDDDPEPPRKIVKPVLDMSLDELASHQRRKRRGHDDRRSRADHRRNRSQHGQDLRSQLGARSKRTFADASQDLRTQLSLSSARTRAYQFDTPNNVEVKDSVVPERVLPNLKLELARRDCLQAALTLFGEQCQERLNILPPKHNLARWLYQQLSVPSGPEQVDALFRYPKSMANSKPLRDEIARELPCRIPNRAYKHWPTGLAVVETFVTTARDWLAHIDEMAAQKKKAMTKAPADADVSEDSAAEGKTPAAEVEETKAEEVLESDEHLGETMRALERAEVWLRLQRHSRLPPNFEELRELLTFLSTAGSEAIREAADPEIEDILKKTEACLEDALAKLAEIRAEPVDEALEIECEMNDDKVVLRCPTVGADCLVSMKSDHYHRLAKLYRTHCEAFDPERQHFHRLALCVGLRYQTILFEPYVDGENSMPAAFKAFLTKQLHCCFDSFASPFNAYYRNFASAAPDLDSFFGSVGSFFDFTPSQGSFVAFPPFVELVLDRTADRIEALLNASSDPLSFVVMMPEWRLYKLHALDVLDQSPHRRADFLIEGNKQAILSGQSWYGDVGQQWKLARFGDYRVYVLQNEAGFAQWGAGVAALEENKRAFGASDA
ncbi:uncharacterized protein MONBRDRAFT_6793 [Monosiga brevicollis MX1]|uniref:PCIF1 WW domain-containing protein n=1 Tax=Monosiga brevicollis TaxID=81824 RepID=A9UVB7_MONBE|nr:uncharacterized protein MONBRDRAFT_6793 [Monosiga brevicollis MX1]EDQ90865.1 predicted protein [Monosiga brevicollis MX1]|eukprot:XP_001744162.1 hypothetical protein [Monosiga brevicollis MX1]